MRRCTKPTSSRRVYNGGAGELVGAASGPAVSEHADDGLSHVLYIHGLQPGAAAAHLRHHGEHPGDVGERAEQGVA